jgi:pimeloyl-ACP methyl ester carboxylesterase
MARDLLDFGPRRLAASFAHMVADRVEVKLPLISAPALVVRGERDSIVPRRWGQEVANLLPRGAYAEIPGAGHALNFSRPADLARLVLPFLSVPMPEHAGTTR